MHVLFFIGQEFFAEIEREKYEIFMKHIYRP